MATTTNFGWETPDDTDLVKDGAAAMRTLGNSIDTSFVDLKGGTTGQVLAKASASDLDYTWTTPQVGDITAVTATTPLTGGGTTGDVTIGIQSASTTQVGAVQLTDSTSSTSTTTAATPNAVKTSYDLASTANSAASTAQTTANAAIPKSTVTTSGDIIYATGSSAVTRLGVGSTGQVLTVAGGVPSWATPSASGSGLTYITGASFTSVTAANVNNCFTSTYQAYLIVLTIDNYSIDQPLYMRFRASGSDNSTSNYVRNTAEMNSTGIANSFLDNTTEIRLGAVDSAWSNARFGAVMTIQNPQLAKATLAHLSVVNTGYASEPTHNFGNGVFKSSTQFDGFSIVTLRTDTMTGNYKVYGYANS